MKFGFAILPENYMCVRCGELLDDVCFMTEYDKKGESTGYYHEKCADIGDQAEMELLERAAKKRNEAEGS